MKKVFSKKVAETAKSLSESQSVEKENLEFSQHESVDIEQAFKESEVKVDKLKLEDAVLKALEVLPEDLALTLTNRANRFFKKSEEYQSKHLASFVDSLVNTIDHYILPPTPSEVVAEDDSDEVVDVEYKEIRNDVLVNIAIALASLVVFYPLVLFITSKVQGHSFGFYRVNDGRNEADLDLANEIKEAKQQLTVIVNSQQEAQPNTLENEFVNLENSL